MNIYSVYVNDGVSDRSIQIVTDTFQNACSIARAQCRNGEQVTSVVLCNTDVIIDFAAAKPKDSLNYGHC